MNRKDVEKYILSLPNTRIDFPFGEEVAVYKVTVDKDDERMFALIPEKQNPVSLSLKCAPELAILLREKYESVMEGYHLNKKHWNTILLTGQLSIEDIKALILHSYNLVTKIQSDTPEL
jgi:predicted DNA-binding protein (MmcQ/YjbR family)